jgi:hypothetical protein
MASLFTLFQLTNAPGWITPLWYVVNAELLVWVFSVPDPSGF